MLWGGNGNQEEMSTSLMVVKTELRRTEPFINFYFLMQHSTRECSAILLNRWLSVHLLTFGEKRLEGNINSQFLYIAASSVTNVSR